MTWDTIFELVDELGESDELVLQCIDQGLDNVRKITGETRLDKDDVNNRYRKLSRLGLIEVGESNGMVEDYVDGKRQVFREPKPAWLTDLGREVVEVLEDDRVEEYRSMSHDELVEKVIDLEDEVENLHDRIDALKVQIQSELYGDGN